MVSALSGYRNLILALAAVTTSTYLVYVGLSVGADLLALSTVIGAKDAAIVGAIFGRAFNKRVEASKGEKGGDKAPVS